MKRKATYHIAVSFTIPFIMLVFVWMNAHWSVALLLTYLALHNHLDVLKFIQDREGGTHEQR